MMEAGERVALSQASFGGRLMALPEAGGNKDGVGLLWIRQDWLDELNLKAPKTIEEMISLAATFKEADPDGTGSAYGLGIQKDFFTSGLGELMGFFEGFGAYTNGWVEGAGGKAEYGRIQPAVREALETVAGMYKNGLIDQEFLTKDGGKFSEDVVSGKVGMYYGQHWNAFWPLPDCINNNPKADWIPYAFPTIDDSPRKQMVGGAAGSYYAVNVDCEHPEAAVKMYNMYYLKDCALSDSYDRNFHLPGTEENEHPEGSYQWAILKAWYPLQNLFIHRGVVRYLNGDKSAIENSWVSDNALSCERYLADPAANQSDWAALRWSGPQSAFSVVDYFDTNNLMLQDLFIKGDTESMIQYNATLNQLSETTFSRIIMGEDPISEFDVYVEKWKSLGGDEITKEVNEAIG
jgi:putative aldouronate transport system substrate-binding protein